MAAPWMLLEVYRENGGTWRTLIESGLAEDEAKETAREFNENMRVFGVSGHWVEAVPDPAGSAA